MKRSIRRWLGLAVVPAALALFGAVAPAQAATYFCDNDPNPGPRIPAGLTEQNPLQGSVEIGRQGECIILNDIVATSTINITNVDGPVTTQKLISTTSGVFVNNGNDKVTTKDIQAGTFVSVLAGLASGPGPSGLQASIEIQGPITINATEMQDDNPSVHGNVLLRAVSSIKTMDISTGGNFPGGGKKTGGVQIDAFLLAGVSTDIPVFTIGADTSNGVNGVISTETVTGGGTSGTGTILGGVRITNGAPGNTGGIKVEKMNKIKVQGSASRSGWIQLNAQDGTLTLPTNKLNADGLNGNRAGAIFLAAKTIETEDGTVISASQDDTAPGSVHQVVIAAEEIKFKGADGLKIKADGNGVSQTPFLPATLYVLPKGGINPTSTNLVQSLLWTIPFNGQFFQFPGTVFFNGDASAPLVISADGNHTQLAMTGYPMNFTGGEVTIRAKGNLNHQIVMGYFGSFDGFVTKGISFDNTGLVKINASGKNSGDAGGRIQIQTDLISLKAIAVDQDPEAPPTDPRDIVIKADGPSAGNGNGGEVIILGSQINLDPVSKARVSASAAPNGTGNAIVNNLASNGPHAVRFEAGSSNITFGNAAGRFKIAATGGMTGGNAGSVKVFTAGTIEVRNAEDLINASASDSSGTGGKIRLSGASVKFRTPNGGPSAVKVSVNASGQIGGEIEVDNASAIPPQGMSTFPFVPHLLMNVDGAPGAAAGTFYGRIKSNNVTCRQYKTQYQTWPKTYWDCDNPEQVSSREQAAIDAAGGLQADAMSFSTTLDTNDAQIYIFNEPANMNTFMADSVAGNANGVSEDSLKYSAIFRTVSGDDVSNWFEGNLMHEIGHLLDAYSGNPSQTLPFSGGATPNPAGDSEMDQAAMATASCAQVFNNPSFCSGFANPWDTFSSKFIQGQDVNEEMFTFAFQECSGFNVEDPELNFAEASVYMSNVKGFMNSTFWPGGCRP